MNAILLTHGFISATVAKMVDSCASCIHTANTNCADVEVVKTVCLTIIVVSVIIAVTLLWGLCLRNKGTNVEKAVKTGNQSCNITNDNAMMVLNELVQLTRDKNGVANEEYAKGLYALYKEIKESPKDKDHNN